MVVLLNLSLSGLSSKTPAKLNLSANFNTSDIWVDLIMLLFYLMIFRSSPLAKTQVTNQMLPIDATFLLAKFYKFVGARTINQNSTNEMFLFSSRRREIFHDWILYPFGSMGVPPTYLRLRFSCDNPNEHGPYDLLCI